MRDLAVTLVILGAVPFILARPWVGVLVWSWISYMVPHRLAWSWATHLPFAQVVGLATIVAAMFSKDRRPFPVRPITVVWIAFIAYLTVTTILAMYPAAAWVQWEKVVKIQFFALLTLMLIQTREQLNLLIWVVIASIGFYGAKGGIYTATGGGGLVWGPQGGFFGGNNELALTLLVTAPFMYFQFLHATRNWLRFGTLIVLVLSLVAAVGTFSRGAFVAGACMFIALWWKSRHKILVGVVGSALLAGVLALAPQEWWDRMSTIETYEQDRSAMGRIDAWSVAIGIASNRVTGGGFECWSPANFSAFRPGAQSRDVHSIYFEVLGEHGWIGLALFLTLGLLAWRTASWIVRTTRNRKELIWYRDLAALAQVSLVAYASGGAFLGLAYFDLPYTIVGVLVIARLLVERELASPIGEREVHDPQLAAASRDMPAVAWVSGTGAVQWSLGSSSKR